MTSSGIPWDADELGAGVRVALVDSGVYAAHPHVDRHVESHRWDEDRELFVPCPAGDMNGHGTAIAGALLQVAPSVELLSFGVLDRSLACTAWSLAEGIRSAAHAGADIINLSLGTTTPEHAPLLKDAVEEAAQHGAICITAAHQHAAPSWPADLASVISAVSHPDCPLERFYRAPVWRETPEGGRIILARYMVNGHARPPAGGAPGPNFRGTSIGAAILTAYAARVLQREGGRISHKALCLALDEASSGPLPPLGDPL